MIPPPSQTQLIGGPGGQVIGPSTYNPHRTYMPVNYNNKSGDIIVDTGGRVKKSRNYRKSKKCKKSKKSKKCKKSKKSKKSKK